jgi:hypothetical protein
MKRINLKYSFLMQYPHPMIIDDAAYKKFWKLTSPWKGIKSLTGITHPHGVILIRAWGNKEQYFKSDLIWNLDQCFLQKARVYPLG